MLFTTLFAFMPIYIALVVFLLSQSEQASLVLDEMWTTGDLLLVSVAMAGPIMYVMFKQYREEGSPGFQFPSNWFFVLVIFVIGIISSVVFAVAKFYGKQIGFDHELVKHISFLITAVIIILVYLIVSVKNMLERQDAPQLMRADTQAFISNWESK